MLRWPENATVDRLMASDALDRCEDLEARKSAGKEASVLKQESSCGPCRIEYSSPSKNKKVDESSCFHDNLTSRFQSGENIKGQDADGQISLSSENKGKLLARKSAKEPVAIPSKRPRIDESENCVNNTGTNGHDGVSTMAGFDPIRCTADKSQIITQKRAHDGKRADKRNCRASMRNKYESLASKAGIVCNDSLSGGNSILGSHGFKSDTHDIVKQLEELSLFDLLNGSYQYSMLPMDKGKKSSNSIDNILYSVRKACSILCPPPHALVENGNNSKACQDPSFSTGSSSNCELKDKQLEESLTTGKVQETSHANWINYTTLFQPKKILDQLALPSARELESFLFNPNMNSVSPQCMAKTKNCGATDLPPFPWSFSHGSNTKPCVESYKMNATKSACQGKWVRIGHSFSSISGHRSGMDSLNQQKINDVLEWMKSSTVQPTGDGPFNKFSIVGTRPEVQVEENVNSVDGSVLPGPFNLKTFKTHEIPRTMNGNHLECDSKGHAPQEFTAPVVSKDHIAGTTNGCSVSSFSYTCRDATVRSCDNSCPCCQNLKCKQAYPEEVLSAAATLLHMGRTPRHRSAPKYSSGRNRWPKAPSMKKMKERKSSTSILNIPEIPSSTAGCNNPIRKANMPSSDHQPTVQRKMDFIPPNGSCRESSSRWSSPTSKVEKDPNQGVPHGNSSFRHPLAPFSARAADKACENPIKEPHAKPPSAAFKGSSIRDWIRCRNKR